MGPARVALGVDTGLGCAGAGLGVGVGLGFGAGFSAFLGCDFLNSSTLGGAVPVSWS